MLAIDELGKGRMTDWELTIIDEVISRRYNAQAVPGNHKHAPECPQAMRHNQPHPAGQTLGDLGEQVFSACCSWWTFVD